MNRVERFLTWLFGIEEINGHGRCPTYLYRWTIWQPKWAHGFGVYLHKFVGDDWSLDLHDHPKRFISIGLKGRYTEERPTSPPYLNRISERLSPRRQFIEYNAPWVRTFGANHVHRISGPSPQHPCWTLVIVLTHVREWGFWHDGYWIPWRSYVKGDQSDIADKMRACP